MWSHALTFSPRCRGASQRMAFQTSAITMVNGIANIKERSVCLRLPRPRMVPTRRPVAVSARAIQAEVAP